MLRGHSQQQSRSLARTVLQELSQLDQWKPARTAQRAHLKQLLANQRVQTALQARFLQKELFPVQTALQAKHRRRHFQAALIVTRDITPRVLVNLSARAAPRVAFKQTLASLRAIPAPLVRIAIQVRSPHERVFAVQALTLQKEQLHVLLVQLAALQLLI